MIFGLLDCGMALLLFLPFFGQNANGMIQDVSLLSLVLIQPYLKAAYLIDVFAMIAMGIATLAMQNCRQVIWMQIKYIVSIALSVVSVCLFIISQQPYAAVFTFAFLSIKAFMLIKRR